MQIWLDLSIETATTELILLDMNMNRAKKEKNTDKTSMVKSNMKG